MSLEPLEQWRTRGERRTVQGRSLFRVAAGEAAGLPVVLVHGFPTSSHDWSAALPRLAERRRVLALDLLGFGLSEKPYPHVYSIGEQVDLLEAWLAQEKVERAHFLAHDMGDTVVQELLARRLEKRPGVEPASIVLLNGGILVEMARPILVQRLLLKPVVGPLVARLMNRRSFDRSLRGIAGPGKEPSAAELAALYELVVESQGRRVYPALIRYVFERTEKRERWRRATLEHPWPMRLAWGDADPISGWDMAAEVARLRPATSAVRLEGTGHYPQVEEPARVAELALEWFDRTDERSDN